MRSNRTENSLKGRDNHWNDYGNLSIIVRKIVTPHQLHGWFEKALGGERQIVFISGEVGIGKTTLLEAFLEHMSAAGGMWIGRGQGIEHSGTGEAYLPVLEALGRLCRETEGERFIEFLAQHAPTWLVQMPSLLRAAEFEALQRRVGGTTMERMLREMVEAVETLTAEQMLVLILENLHWSDSSTLELLGALAQRREQARLLVIGTYRPVEVIVHDHPLLVMKQELQLHGQGLGKKLLCRVMAWASEQEATQMKLWVTAGNSLATPLYESAGFVPTGATEALRAASSLHILEMARGL